MQIIGGEYKNRKIFTPKGMSVRPTSALVRSALFNICQRDIEDAFFLDLFAGSGAMGLEALSRGASMTTFVDNNRESIRCIKNNIEALECQDRSTVFSGDVLKIVNRLELEGDQYDIIYVDPPYNMVDYVEKLIYLMDSSSLLNETGALFIELGQELELIKKLSTLKLKSARKYGNSILHQFEKGKAA